MLPACDVLELSILFAASQLALGVLPQPTDPMLDRDDQFHQEASISTILRRKSILGDDR